MATEKAKKFQYTDENTAVLVKAYEDRGAKSNADFAEEFAVKFGVPSRSIVSKLSSVGVYVKDTPKASRPKDEGPTKKEIMKEISDLGMAVDGFEGATKEALARVRDWIKSNTVKAD